jgi:hypothetical protein
VSDAPASFDPLQHPSAFLRPLQLSAISAWVQHIPFAFVLAELCRPRLFVELGASHGDSYCAFCQAFVHHQIPARAFAVDTWKGDPQEGFYDPNVLQMLRAYHDPLYGNFSTLLQMDFDSAQPQIPDASIDLLHIDGLHSYEAVRHDFEHWSPKLSDRAVVLFHDTAVHDPGFGVHQLWAELAPMYPHFEFPHGYGLGMLAVGAKAPPPLLDASARANPRISEYFATLAHRVEVLRTLMTVMAQVHHQQSMLDDWRRQIGEPVIPGDHSLATAFANPPAFVHAVTQDLQKLAIADLEERKSYPSG